MEVAELVFLQNREVQEWKNGNQLGLQLAFPQMIQLTGAVVRVILQNPYVQELLGTCWLGPWRSGLMETLGSVLLLSPLLEVRCCFLQVAGLVVSLVQERVHHVLSCRSVLEPPQILELEQALLILVHL